MAGLVSFQKERGGRSRVRGGGIVYINSADWFVQLGDEKRERFMAVVTSISGDAVVGDGKSSGFNVGQVTSTEVKRRGSGGEVEGESVGSVKVVREK